MTHTYIDTLPEAKVEQTIVKLREVRPDLIAGYAGGDERFALWMHLCDRRCRSLTGLETADLEDHLWRDAYDAGQSPRDAVDSAIEASGF